MMANYVMARMSNDMERTAAAMNSLIEHPSSPLFIAPAPVNRPGLPPMVPFQSAQTGDRQRAFNRAAHLVSQYGLAIFEANQGGAAYVRWKIALQSQMELTHESPYDAYEVTIQCLSKELRNDVLDCNPSMENGHKDILKWLDSHFLNAATLRAIQASTSTTSRGRTNLWTPTPRDLRISFKSTKGPQTNEWRITNKSPTSRRH